MGNQFPRVAVSLLLVSSFLSGCASTSSNGSAPLNQGNWPICSLIGGLAGGGLGSIESSAWAAGGAAAGAIVGGLICYVQDGDADGDGVFDRRDDCPNTPSGATVDSRGCPQRTYPQATTEAPPPPEDETIVLSDMGNVLLFFSHERMCEQMGRVCGRTAAEVWAVVMDSGLQARFECGMPAREYHRLFAEAVGAAVDFDELMQAHCDIFRPNAALVPGPAKADGNNFAPRVGFAWSPRSSNSLLGDGKTVFRGGFGMGYDVLFYNILTVNTNPIVQIVSLQNLVDVYPNKRPASGSPATFDPGNAYTNSPSDIQNPDSKYWSVSVGRELGDFVVEVGYTGSKGGHGVNQVHMNPGTLTPEQAALVAATQNPNAIPSLQARRVFPQYGVRTSIPAYVGPVGNDVEARSEYHGVYASVNKRLRHGLQFGLSYTRSRFESNNDASLGEAGTDGSSQRPQSFFNYNADWSVSQFDVPNRFVANYLWEIPGPKSGALKQILGGWQLSGITAYQSGRPFTIWIGVDSNGDGTTGSDRPNINGACGVSWDENHRGFTNDGCYTAPLGTNGLPLQNGLGDGSAPRNGERGAGYWTTDLSLMKRFYLFGATASFAELVGYYRTQTGERGDLVFKEPPTHMFTGGTLARYRDETMAFPPSVTIKDWTTGGSAGYPNPKTGAQPSHFPTVIMIVPPPTGTPPPR